MTPGESPHTPRHGQVGLRLGFRSLPLVLRLWLVRWPPPHCVSLTPPIDRRRHRVDRRRPAFVGSRLQPGTTPRRTTGGATFRAQSSANPRLRLIVCERRGGDAGRVAPYPTAWSGRPPPRISAPAACPATMARSVASAPFRVADIPDRSPTSPSRSPTSRIRRFQASAWDDAAPRNGPETTVRAQSSANPRLRLIVYERRGAHAGRVAPIPSGMVSLASASDFGACRLSCDYGSFGGLRPIARRRRLRSDRRRPVSVLFVGSGL